jgi:hypothetical protein
MAQAVVAKIDSKKFRPAKAFCRPFWRFHRFSVGPISAAAGALRPPPAPPDRKQAPEKRGVKRNIPFIIRKLDRRQRLRHRRNFVQILVKHASNTDQNNIKFYSYFILIPP